MGTTDFDFTDILEIQQKINIKRVYLEDEASYASYIKDFDHEYILIEIPFSGTSTVSLVPGGVIELTIITGDGIWIGECEIVEFAKGKNGGVWISIPEFAEKIQRREFIRINEDFQVLLSYIDGDRVVEWQELKSYNISGGGLALYSRRPLQNKGVIKLGFEYGEILLETRAKYIHTQYDAKEKKYWTGFELLDIDHKTSDFIHVNICKRQIEYRKKGLL